MSRVVLQGQAVPEQEHPDEARGLHLVTVGTRDLGRCQPRDHSGRLLVQRFA